MHTANGKFPFGQNALIHISVMHQNKEEKRENASDR